MPHSTAGGPGRIHGDGSVTAHAPAKVNVHLGVGPLRADGFHELTTVYLAVSLLDSVTVWPDDGLSVTVTGEGADGSVPTDSRNLVWQAAELLARHAGVPADAALHVDKSIPAAAGLAGGSADAAAALVALDALWGTHCTRGDLAGLAARLGSDVPFSLVGGTALGTGRGEQLSPVLSRHRTDWVLGIAGDGLATPTVYRELDRLRDTGDLPPASVAGPADDVLTALRGGDAAELAGVLANDLQAPAVHLRPELRRALGEMTAAGCLGVLVSGSGPTVAGLLPDADAAQAAAAALAAGGAFRAVHAVHGPVPGARLAG
ncbi:4-(cytidine 5'-diphospho)-2-C-methyl-D-erythritol kinase [Klenkia brasiliensis]|uniref:4-diphosphocytidyl-2-C-methyl-D-erythritol kinase n=1 Tax=Klenkia brasiliensis TaxID=333142 RepID=A0A1G7LQG4_9ACTN|nr:4-(cytidine 5'-diphospho)-2-C-methyl-D-erythritol kinase [Klenkia brasiliensis]SDF51757.1 4-diphosphocytidyl-2-C-methyl-D-erythritol kinase [Klenkia brasiliensis]